MADGKRKHGGSRPGSGRPLKYGEQTVAVPLTVPRSMKIAIESEAESEGISRSEWIIQALQNTVRVRKATSSEGSK